jgi:hypothetical protein
MIFSETWQRNLQDAEHKQDISTLLKEKLGDQDYQKLQEVKGWLENHSEKAMLLGYLVKQDY